MILTRAEADILAGLQTFDRTRPFHALLWLEPLSFKYLQARPTVALTCDSAPRTGPNIRSDQTAKKPLFPCRIPGELSCLLAASHPAASTPFLQYNRPRHMDFVRVTCTATIRPASGMALPPVEGRRRAYGAAVRIIE